MRVATPRLGLRLYAIININFNIIIEIIINPFTANLKLWHKITRDRFKNISFDEIKTFYTKNLIFIFFHFSSFSRI